MKLALLIAAFMALTPAQAAPRKTVPKDALVLEKGVVIRQFGDSQGKVMAKLEPCDELVLLEPVGKKTNYVEAIFLSRDAQKVRRGWVKPSNSLYIFPDPRPALPRANATPEVAFPWGTKAPQPGDPDYARVTQKSFLFSCLSHPHPTKIAAVLSQILDRYTNELTADEIKIILPMLRYAREEDLARIRELLVRFKGEPAVVEFLAANPLFGPVIEPEQKMAPVLTPTPTPKEEDKKEGLFGIPFKILGAGVAGGAVFLGLIAFLIGRRKKKAFDEEPTGQGPSI